MGLTFVAVIQVLVLIYLFLETPKYGLNRWTWALAGLLFGFFSIAVLMLRTNRIWLGVFWFVLGLVNLILFFTRLQA